MTMTLRPQRLRPPINPLAPQATYVYATVVSNPHSPSHQQQEEGFWPAEPRARRTIPQIGVIVVVRVGAAAMTISAQVHASRLVPSPGLLRSLLTMVTAGTLTGSYTTFMIVVTARADSDVEIRSGSIAQWIVARRYSSFRHLHRCLSAKFASLPALPAPRPLLNMDPVFLEGRRAALDRYLVGLLSQKAIVISEELQQFLHLHEHGVTLRDPPKLMATTVLNDQVFSVRSLVFANDVVVTACEDMALFNRLDSLLTNTRLPWEKQGAIVPVGCINVWSQRQSAEWVVSASAYFPSAVPSVAYDRRHRQVFAALSSGMVQAYALNAAYSQLSDCRIWPVHQKKIQQAHYLNRCRMLVAAGFVQPASFIEHCFSSEVSDHFVTCSLDCTIAMTDTHSSLLIARSHFDEPVQFFEITEDENWFIGGTPFSILVVGLTDNQFRLVRRLSDHVVGPITALHFHPEQKALFTSVDCICTVYSLSKSDLTVTFYRRVAELNGGPTSAIGQIAFSAHSSQIVTAHRNGCIAVWDATGSGSIKYVIRAHEAEITSLQWFTSDRLISSSLDGCVKFWSLPINIGDGAPPPIAKMVLRSHRASASPPPPQYVPCESRPRSRSSHSNRSSSPESVEIA